MIFTKRRVLSRDPNDRMMLDLTRDGDPAGQITPRRLFQHTLITGIVGSSKTTTVGRYLSEAILDKKGLAEEEQFGMVILLYKANDMKDWLTLIDQAGRSDNVVIIDEQSRNFCNILEHFGHMEAITLVEILMVLAKLSSDGSGQSQEAFWTEALRARLYHLILLNKCCFDEEVPLNIMTLHALHSSAPASLPQVNDPAFYEQSLCMKMIEKAEKRYGEHHSAVQMIRSYFLQKMATLNDRTQSSILAMTDMILQPFLSSPMLNRLFCGSTAQPLEALLRGKLVLLNLPVQKLGHSARIGQILIKHLLQKTLEARDLEHCPNPTIFWADEAHQFLSIYDPSFLSTSRSARGGMVLISQNLSNIQSAIGGDPALARVRMNNLTSLCGTKFFLAQSDAMVTNPYASNLMGKGLHSLPGSSVNLREFGGSASVSSTYAPFVMAHELSLLKTGGVEHQGIVEAYMVTTGKPFKDGKNHRLIEFRQPWFS